MKASEEQKEFIWKKFEEGITDIKPLTSDFVDKFFPDEPDNMKDGRSKYGRLVKDILVEKGLKGAGAVLAQAADLAVPDFIFDQDKYFENKKV